MLVSLIVSILLLDNFSSGLPVSSSPELSRSVLSRLSTLLAPDAALVPTTIKLCIDSPCAACRPARAPGGLTATVGDNKGQALAGADSSGENFCLSVSAGGTVAYNCWPPCREMSASSFSSPRSRWVRVPCSTLSACFERWPRQGKSTGP